MVIITFWHQGQRPFWDQVWLLASVVNGHQGWPTSATTALTFFIWVNFLSFFLIPGGGACECAVYVGRARLFIFLFEERLYFMEDVAGCHTKYFKRESRGKGRQKNMPLKVLLLALYQGHGDPFFLLRTEGQKESQKTRYLGHTPPPPQKRKISNWIISFLLFSLSHVIFISDMWFINYLPT